MPNATDPKIVRSEGAARLLTEACNAAHARGLAVATTTDLGVVCTSVVEPIWETDPRAAGVVSPLGAVLLERQPPIADVDHALAWVFGSRPEFTDGIEDGVAGKRDVSRDDRLYAEGAFIGVQLRDLLHRRQGVPVERAGLRAVPAAEVTRPVETPAAVLAELLGSATVAQVLEALAETVAGRKWSKGPDDAAEFCEILRELAQCAREDEGEG